MKITISKKDKLITVTLEHNEKVVPFTFDSGQSEEDVLTILESGLNKSFKLLI